MKTKTIQDLTIYNEGYKEGKRQATLSQRQDDVKEFLKDLKEYRDNDTILLGHLVKKYEQEIKK